MELRKEAEDRCNHWKAKAGRLTESLKTASAALSNQSGCIQYMNRFSTQYYDEVKVARLKFGRWDERNWADLAVSMLKGKEGDALSMDYTHDITDSVAFAPELRAIHARRDEQCREHLEGHAFATGKCLLAKMANRTSNRKAFWCNSLFKFDHSVRNEEGKRVRTK